MVDGTFVTEIRRLADEARPDVMEINGESFTSLPVHHLPRRREETVDAIALSSLQGVVDYLAVQKDGLDPTTHFIHLESATSVRIVGPLLGQGETNQRHEYLRAFVQTEGFPFGRQVPREDMQILLQTRFRENEDRARALQIIGTLATEESVRQEDDGITQRVTAKSGVARLEERSIENPFQLAPFRTFPEIEAPESPFVLRLKKEQHGILAMLIEADGGAWKIEAVDRIRRWLEEAATGFRVIS